MSHKKEKREVIIVETARIYVCDKCSVESPARFFSEYHTGPREMVPIGWAWLDIQVYHDEEEPGEYYQGQFCPKCIRAMVSWFRETSIQLAGMTSEECTVVVAGSNSTAHDKADADLVCNGIDDEAEIIAALNTFEEGQA